jgi:hypothetical protein
MFRAGVPRRPERRRAFGMWLFDESRELSSRTGLAGAGLQVYIVENKKCVKPG